MMATTLSPASIPEPAKAAVSTEQVIEIDERADSPVEDLETTVPRTIDELIRLRAQQAGNNKPIVAYPESGTDYIDYTPKELDELVERAAVYYSAIIPQRLSSEDAVEVVGILGNSDLSYLVTFLAVSRLGHSSLLLSTRITEEAHISLLSTTKATTLLHQDAFADVAGKVGATLPNLRVSTIASATSLPTGTQLQPVTLDPIRETSNISFIIHSSGSTGLPKPIFQTHRASLYAYSLNFGLVGHITLPLYHNHGICCLFRAIYSRRKIYIYNARLPLASQHLLATLQQHPEIKILYGVPYALKLLAESEQGLAELAKRDIVMFGGSACPKPIGDKLVNSGVNLVGHYGATEVGQLMTSFRKHQEDKGWDWLRVPPNLKPFLLMESRGPNLFELCVAEGWPSKVATNREDGSYATKDLFEPHPVIPDTWRYYARLDDTIVLENGEKANPLMVEGVIRQNPNVAEAVVFGANKPRLGAFIIPATTSYLTDDAIIDAVMPAISEMNGVVPAYSQLTRDMIRVLPRDVDYRRTDKGTVIRAAFYRDFASQIEATYVDEQTGSLQLPRDELKDLLRKEFVKRVKEGAVFDDDTDLFSLGVDSLQAIQVRSFILKNLAVDAKSIGRNFVFDYPTISQMADEIMRLQSGKPEAKKTTVEERMASMIEKYAVFDHHVPVDRADDGEYIVLTGATGSLGAHAVAQLACRETVKKIYCLVRAPSTLSAAARVVDSLRERLLFDQLSSSAQAKILPLPSNLGDSQLGLDLETYSEIAENVTQVITLAWSVNFNKALESFEADCVAGAKHLIELCLKAKRPQPASFNFCSSVSTTANTAESVVPEALPESLSYAQGMGYAQSKLVTEVLCDRASKQTGIKARVLRVGQIIGDTQHGVWNDNEAIPMIFQTAKTIGALPALDESPAWLPVDVVASACVDIACSKAESGVMNVVNHNTFHWTRDLLPLLQASGLQFEQVSQQDWVKRLRSSDADPIANPPIKLVDFFASKYENDRPRRSLAYATESARSQSEALRKVGVLNEPLVAKIVAYLSSRWSA